MDPLVDHFQDLTRRELLRQTGMGIGSIALGSLLSGETNAAGAVGNSLAQGTSHFAPRAKSVIFMHMVGAPSQLELLEYKPALQAHDGEPCPKALIEDARFAFIRGHPRLLGTRVKFAKHGQSGRELSELLPRLATVADEIAVVKTLHTEQFNHGPAQLFFHTGFGRFGRPSFGAWVSYGLGSVNENLPAYVVLNTGGVAGGGNALWGNGFLPSVYQGIEFRSQGDPVLFLSNPKGIDGAYRRRMLDDLERLNQEQLAAVGDPEIATRISQYEMAFRMQSSVPELMDISEEAEGVLGMYGAKPGAASFANNCLLARRLVERGVRFVQLFDQGWDHHSNVFESLPKKCEQVDRPAAALVKDLKQRGLLDETLVIWSGEFGRTPMLQEDVGDGSKSEKPGRDHHKDAFCCWMAGGGVKAGATIGKTDELGYKIVEDPVHVNDFHATLLHLLGMNHEHLTYKFQGRQFRLTDVGGKVVEKLLG
jgi:hypothetical protein